MFKKLLQLKTLLIALLVMTGAGNVWGEEVTEVTYTFTTKDWGATRDNTQEENWTKGKGGERLTQGQGIQVTTGASGANGTSPVSYSNISKIVVRYCTNKKSGAGTIKVKVGDGTEKSFTVSAPSSDGTTLKDATFDFSPVETGNVKVTVNCTTNSVYIYSVTITYSSGSSTEKCATPTFSPAAGTYTSAQNVTISTTTDGATIYYTTDGTDPTESSSVYSTPIYVSKTTTIKAMAAKEGMTNSSVATAVVTVTVTDSEPKFYKVTDAEQLSDGDKIAIVSEKYNVAMSTTQNSNNRGETGITIKDNSFESTNEVQVITLKHLDENWRLYTGSGYLYAASSSKNYLRTKETEDKESKVSIAITDGNASMEFQGDYTHNVLQYNSNSNLFSCYESASQESIQIYRQELPLSVTAAGYATFSSTSALDFTNVVDIHAYTATVNGNTISFKRVKKVPAKTGLLLRSVNVNGDPVSTRVPLYDGATYDVTDNAFVAATTEIASLATTEGDYTNYILNKPSGGSIGFYQANGQKVGAGKAYLRVSSKQATRAYIAFSFDDPETGVAQVETLPQQGVAYDLQGRRVNSPKGGLYIINGKKVIVK